MVAVVPAAIIVLAILNLNIPYLALRPGPVHDVVPLIALRGAQVFPVRGQLLLTTVQLQPVTAAAAIRSWIDPSEAVVERAAFVPPGETEEDVVVRSSEQMAESQVLAAAAALRRLGYPVRRATSGARVAQVLEDAPASGVLRPGDEIVAIDGERVESPDDLVVRIRRHRVGDTVGLRVRRTGREVTLRIGTVASPSDPAVPVVGATLEPVASIRLPIDVRIEDAGIGGPSAGLLYALGIVELLGRPDLARGRRIAGTGTIDLDGGVGAVGGIEQKVVAARRADADLFIAPQPEQRAACPHAGDMRVVGVQTLDEAVRALGDEAFARALSCEAISARTGTIGRTARR